MWRSSCAVELVIRRPRALSPSLHSGFFYFQQKDQRRVLFSTPAYLTIQPTVKRSVLIKRKCPRQQKPKCVQWNCESGQNWSDWKSALQSVLGAARTPANPWNYIQKFIYRPLKQLQKVFHSPQLIFNMYIRVFQWRLDCWTRDPGRGSRCASLRKDRRHQMCLKC